VEAMQTGTLPDFSLASAEMVAALANPCSTWRNQMLADITAEAIPVLVVADHRVGRHRGLRGGVT
jgi:hypothetical protein